MYPKIKTIGNKLDSKNIGLFFPPQHQDTMPGLENIMNPLPIYENPEYIGSHKLKNKVAIISGGDSRNWSFCCYLFCKRRCRCCYCLF